MLRSVRELMKEIIDYAGLFPPAKLPLAPALRNYADHRAHAFNWMLARFVCPAAKMGELEEHAEALFRDGAPPWRFSALGRSGKDAESFVTGFAADLDAMRTMARRYEGRAVADALETRMPESVVAACDRSATRKLVCECADLVASMETTSECGPLQVFFEIPFLDDWRSNTESVISALAEYNAEAPSPSRVGSMGAKIRTGGVTAAMIPPVQQVAFFIHCCRTQGVRFKATAGLHHPLRRHSGDVDTKMHGFLNVFGAAILSHAIGISESTVREVLEDESLDHFSFDDEGFGWHEHRVSCDQIAKARRGLATSFGSCSFVEPIEDLQELKLL